MKNTTVNLITGSTSMPAGGAFGSSYPTWVQRSAVATGHNGIDLSVVGVPSAAAATRKRGRPPRGVPR